MAITNFDKPVGTEIATLSGKLGNLTMVKVSKSVSIPDGTQTQQNVNVDLSSYIPTGKALHAISNISLSDYCLPYVVNGSVKTWIGSKPGNTQITISNTSSAWNNYVFSCVLFLVDT